MAAGGDGGVIDQEKTQQRALAAAITAMSQPGDPPRTYSYILTQQRVLAAAITAMSQPGDPPWTETIYINPTNTPMNNH